MTTTEESPARPALTPLRQARERFLTGRPLPDGVPDEIVAAWRRARFFGVRHDLAEPSEPLPPTRSALLTAARPVARTARPRPRLRAVVPRPHRRAAARALVGRERARRREVP
ncbi:hypothetical protein ACRJ4W_25285 [Streptomyces sp. GLT-R25]